VNPLNGKRKGIPLVAREVTAILGPPKYAAMPKQKLMKMYMNKTLKKVSNQSTLVRVKINMIPIIGKNIIGLKVKLNALERMAIRIQ
jgi:hypothetical protein